MADALNAPTCVLIVNIQCCAACPKKVKGKLQKVNGVYAVDIDTKNGLVSVRGNVKPSILIQTIAEKIGKKAELHVYEKNPITDQNETPEPDQTNSCSACKYEETDQTCCFADESNDQNKGEEQCHYQAVYGEEAKDNVQAGLESTDSGMKKKKHSFSSWFGKKRSVEPRMFGNFGAPRPGFTRLPPPPPPPLAAPLIPQPPPPPIPPPLYRHGQYPPVYPYSPPHRITKPPRPYPYDFYEKKEPQIGNSAFHSFRDDNVNACSTM